MALWRQTFLKKKCTFFNFFSDFWKTFLLKVNTFLLQTTFLNFRFFLISEIRVKYAYRRICEDWVFSSIECNKVHLILQNQWMAWLIYLWNVRISLKTGIYRKIFRIDWNFSKPQSCYFLIGVTTYKMI